MALYDCFAAGYDPVDPGQKIPNLTPETGTFDYDGCEAVCNADADCVGFNIEVPDGE